VLGWVNDLLPPLSVCLIDGWLVGAPPPQGYLGAISSSAYSFVSMLQSFGPIMKEGGATVSLSFIAAERAIPGYGGGMSTAKVGNEERRRRG